MRCGGILVLALLVLAGASGLPAAAQMPPTFDMVGWCKDDVTAGAFPDVGVIGCVAIEQHKARALRSGYRRVPPATRAECESFALESTNGRGSYALLDFCIEAKGYH